MHLLLENNIKSLFNQDFHNPSSSTISSSITACSFTTITTSSDPTMTNCSYTTITTYSYTTITTLTTAISSPNSSSKSVATTMLFLHFDVKLIFFLNLHVGSYFFKQLLFLKFMKYRF